MPARKVDIVFCLDISDSMKPCIDAVRDHIGLIIDQLKQAKFTWRLGFVAQCVSGRSEDGYVFTTRSLSGGGMASIYHSDVDSFFTSNVVEFKSALNSLDCEGDEDMLLTLDTALDAPFGPKSDTQRVVVLISDEPFETNEPDRFKDSKTKLEEIKQKIMDRGVTLLAVMPMREDGVAEDLSMVDKADFTPVDENDAGLRTVDMSGIFNQLGKTISTATAQSSGTEKYKRALFKQDTWCRASGYNPMGDNK